MQISSVDAILVSDGIQYLFAGSVLQIDCEHLL